MIFENLYQKYPYPYQSGHVHTLHQRLWLACFFQKVVEHGFHRDVEPPIVGAITSILYLNTNNGYTAFEDGTKIPSVANTFVSFPSGMKHTRTTCTDVKFRGVINFNYIIKEVEKNDEK